MLQYFVVFIFLLIVVASLISMSSDRRESARHEIKSKHGRLFHSKVHDAAFFDGENEYYAEAMQRIKQSGGA